MQHKNKYEPNAASYSDRINSLKKLHEKGCKTWVSIEPYPTPNILNQDINKLLETVSFTDKIIFGRLNYNPLVTKYKGYKEYFNYLSRLVKDFCINNNIQYYIKNGTITSDIENAI